jgi:hypothetical protein
VDAYNSLRIAYTDYFRMYASVTNAEQAGSAAAWAQPQLLGTGEPVYYSRTTADGGQRLHFIYTENVYTRTCPICYHVYHRYSDDNGLTWSPPADLSRFATGAVKTQILVDHSDGLHVVWESGPGGSLGQLSGLSTVRYAASYDRGLTWTSPVEFTSPITGSTVSSAKSPAIGLDGQDQLVLVWLGLPEDLVYYQLSNDQGRSWSEPQALPGLWGGQAIYALYDGDRRRRKPAPGPGRSPGREDQGLACAAPRLEWRGLVDAGIDQEL